MQQIALELAEKAAGKKRVCSRPSQSKLPMAGDVFRKENVSCFFICKKEKPYGLQIMLIPSIRVWISR